MKLGPILALSLFSVLAIHPAKAFDPTKIPEDSQVILKKVTLGKTDWTPTPAEVKQALSITHTYLLKPEGGEKYFRGQAAEVLSKGTGYRVQAWGTHLDGKKILHLNFFPPAPASGDDEFKTWKKEEIFVNDGGNAFWNVDIDLAANKVVHFETNGYAGLGRLPIDKA